MLHITSVVVDCNIIAVMTIIAHYHMLTLNSEGHLGVNPYIRSLFIGHALF